jgi:glutathionyl-hydroquinone reductase
MERRGFLMRKRERRRRWKKKKKEEKKKKREEKKAALEKTRRSEGFIALSGPRRLHFSLSLSLSCPWRARALFLFAA